MIVYQNKNYSVVYDETHKLYDVVNRVTNAVEDSDKVMPKALTSAHLFHDALERFYQRRAEEAKTNVVAIGLASKNDTE